MLCSHVLEVVWNHKKLQIPDVFKEKPALNAVWYAKKLNYFGEVALELKTDPASGVSVSVYRVKKKDVWENLKGTTYEIQTKVFEAGEIIESLEHYRIKGLKKTEEFIRYAGAVCEAWLNFYAGDKLEYTTELPR